MHHKSVVVVLQIVLFWHLQRSYGQRSRYEHMQGLHSEVMELVRRKNPVARRVRWGVWDVHQ